MIVDAAFFVVSVQLVWFRAPLPLSNVCENDIATLQLVSLTHGSRL